MNSKVLLSGICFALGLTMNAQNTFPTTGNVGVGTASPQHSLHVKKTTTTDGDLKIDEGKITLGNVSDILMEGQYRAKVLTDGAFRMRSDFPFINLFLTDNPSSPSLIDIAISPVPFGFSHKAVVGDAVFRAGLYGKSLIIANEFKYAGNDIKFTTTAPSESGASTKLIIKNDGSIGIGTETPDAKLAVNGDIHSKEVRIDLNNWPDYVFDENYNLPTIIEAEQHIQEKGYLINMPSAQAIETNGLQLGEVTRLQQEKIEELMLYIIELNKRIELLEQQTTQKQ